MALMVPALKSHHCPALEMHRKWSAQQEGTASHRRPDPFAGRMQTCGMVDLIRRANPVRPVTQPGSPKTEEKELVILRTEEKPLKGWPHCGPCVKVRLAMRTLHLAQAVREGREVKVNEPRRLWDNKKRVLGGGGLDHGPMRAPSDGA